MRRDRAAEQGAARRVFVHVGAPKTGTTYLQGLMLQHQDALREQHGVLYRAEHFQRHFFAALDLQDGMFHGSYVEASRGYWAPLAEEARSWPGTAVISHEVLAAATLEQAQKAVADLAPAEVHVIYTARDLGRQLVSRWQEDVKHGLAEPFEPWWEAVQRHDENHHHARWFWHTDDPTDVLARWGKAVGVERFHLITVPRSRDPRELWARFAQVVGFDPAVADSEDAPAANTGLGVPEIELLRRVNAVVHDRYDARTYGRTVKDVLAHDSLSKRVESRRLTLPLDVFPVVEGLARDWIAHLQEQGVHVVGDLEELLPRRPSSDQGHPSSATEDEVMDAAVWAIADLLETMRQQQQLERLLHRTLRAAPIRQALAARQLAGRFARAVYPRLRSRTGDDSAHHGHH